MNKFLTFLFGLCFTNQIFATVIDFNQHQREIQVKSWKELRDDNIVKQDLDYSCGAASVATLLNQFFYQNITEEQILKIMDKGDLKASFLDMQKALNKLGYNSQGLAVSYNTLSSLKAPVIVYIKHRKTDHFSVIRGINEQFIWLADPSLGNRILSKEQFLEVWQTRNDPLLAGKILVVIPHQGQKINHHYFVRNVKQPNQGSLKMLKIR